MMYIKKHKANSKGNIHLRLNLCLTFSGYILHQAEDRLQDIGKWSLVALKLLIKLSADDTVIEVCIIRYAYWVQL